MFAILLLLVPSPPMQPVVPEHKVEVISVYHVGDIDYDFCDDTECILDGEKVTAADFNSKAKHVTGLELDKVAKKVVHVEGTKNGR